MENIVGILPLAGTASRIRNIPKFLLPCNLNGTLLDNAIEIFHKNGITDIRAGVSEINECILRSDTRINCIKVDTKTMAETVSIIVQEIDKPVLMLMPDTKFNISSEIEEMKSALNNYEIVALVFKIRDDQIGKVGQCEIVNGEIIHVIDKDPFCPYTWVWGALAWKPSLNKYIDPSWNTIGNLIMTSIHKGIRVKAIQCPESTQYWDCGTCEEYFKMVKEMPLPKKPRVGIIYSGQARTNTLNSTRQNDNIVWESTLKNFLNEEFSKKFDYDVFISTDETEQNLAYSHFGNHLKNINLTEKNWFLHHVAVPEFNTVYEKYVSRDFYGCIPYDYAIYQYYRMYVGYLMLKDYQAKTNTHYDLLVRVRPDIRFMQNVVPLFDMIMENPDIKVIIEHEQFMICKPEVEDIFRLFEKYGTYDRPVEEKLAIYLMSGIDLGDNRNMRFSPEKQYVDHMYYTFLSKNISYFTSSQNEQIPTKSIIGIKYSSFCALYRQDGSYGYITNINEWRPKYTLDYIKNGLINDFQKYLQEYPVKE